MGEITEMMEEGILCQMCGVYLNIDHEFEKDDDKFQGTGHWTTCRTCAKPHGSARKKAPKNPKRNHAQALH